MQKIAFEHDLPGATGNGGSASAQVGISGQGWVREAHEVGDVGLGRSEGGMRLIQAMNYNV